MSQTAKTALAEFASSGNESAFRLVVEEFGGLVFSSALRRTDDHELAEEVAQNVFTVMARKAREVARYQSIAGWVFTATRLEAAKALRGRRRHRRKLKALATDSERIDMNNEEQEGWREALPCLEQGLDHLASRDREVLLARYFEGMTFKEIAARFGQSEAACKMRLRRTLDKLHHWMTRQGVSLSVGTITTGLSLAWPKPAVAGFIARISAQAVAKASNLGWGGLLGSVCLAVLSKKIVIPASAIALIAVAILMFPASVTSVESVESTSEPITQATPVQLAAPIATVPVEKPKKLRARIDLFPTPNDRELIAYYKDELVDLERQLERERSEVLYERDSLECYHLVLVIRPLSLQQQRKLFRFEKNAVAEMSPAGGKVFRSVVAKLNSEYDTDKLMMVKLLAPHAKKGRYLLCAGEVTEESLPEMKRRKLTTSFGKNSYASFLRRLKPDWRYEHLFKIEEARVKKGSATALRRKIVPRQA